MLPNFTINLWVIFKKIITIIAVFLLPILALPAILNAVEQIIGRTVPYELALRLVILSTSWLGLLFYTHWWLKSEANSTHRTIFIILLIWFFGLLIVALGDQNNRLMEEYSWIRYTTGLFLFGTGFLAGYLSYQKFADKIISFGFGLASAAFVYAGLDELLQIHEAVAWRIEHYLGRLVQAGDYITLGYAGIGLITIILLIKYGRRLNNLLPRLSKIILLGSALVYLTSTLLDTLDIKLLKILNTYAITQLNLNPAKIFGEIWYLLWPVKNLTNGLEEVLEYLAATGFFIGFYLSSLNATKLSTSESKDRPRASETSRGVYFGKLFQSNTLLHIKQTITVTTLGLTIIILIYFSIKSVPNLQPKQITLEQNNVSVLSRPADGLKHSDDLTYNSNWGVLSANEGGRNIMQYKNGQLKPLPDLKKLLLDPDSVTADDKAIYVSDSTKGIIFKYTTEKGYEPIWTRADGLHEPEGLIVVDNIIFVVDESQGTITKLTRGKSPEIWHPEHNLWQAPEGITYHPVLQKLLVTDDTSGAVFAIDFGKSIELLTKLNKPEDVVVLPNGKILVTDTGDGIVYEVDTNGQTKILTKFIRTYRDLQGIAVDDNNNLYLITSDGFGGVSFVPSILWQINQSQINK